MRKRFPLLLSNKYHIPSTKLGFTIIEVLVVVAVIGILSTMMVFAYNGIQARVMDDSVKSDVERMAALQSGYKYSHGVAGKEYYSGTGPDEELNFTVKTGNVIDVVINDTDYCVRGYNVKATKNSIENEIFKESSLGACELSTLTPSVMAISDSIGTPYWKTIATGKYHVCSITTLGKAYCWGLNSSGQLGDASFLQRTRPVAVNTDTLLAGLTIKSISANEYTTCAVASNDQVYCWGSGNSIGTLGNGTNSNSNVPVSVYNSDPLTLGGKTIKSVSVGGAHACVVASNKKAYCWGDNTYGQLGNDSTTSSNKPVAVSSIGALNGKYISSISAGNSHTCAVTTENNVYCWGKNLNGQLGHGTYDDHEDSPLQITSDGALLGLTIKSIAAGYYHTCAVASNDRVYCWGYGVDGELGQSAFSSTNEPVAVVNSGVLSSITTTKLAVGYFHSCIIGSNANEYCWGHNTYGKLGDGTATNANTAKTVVIPVAIENEQFVEISGGFHFSCSVISDGNIYCRGDTNNGQFGNGTQGSSWVLTKADLPPAT